MVGSAVREGSGLLARGPLKALRLFYQGYGYGINAFLYDGFDSSVGLLKAAISDQIAGIGSCALYGLLFEKGVYLDATTVEGLWTLIYEVA